MSGSNDEPTSIPPAASAASTTTPNTDDMTIAQALQMVETLTSLFGFSYEAANEAVNVLGVSSVSQNDVQTYCDYILDHGLGVDGGGAIAPIDDCPHLLLLTNVDTNSLPAVDIMERPCCYFAKRKDHVDMDAKPSVAPAAPIQTVGRPKDDVDATTGMCPMGENWMCLHCGDVYCSRYVNGHGIQHWEETRANGNVNNYSISSTTTSQTHLSLSSSSSSSSGHCVMVSLADLSVWCHVCSAYLVHDTLQPILRRLEQIKFQSEERKDDVGKEKSAKIPPNE
jgi:hypothetical protein